MLYDTESKYDAYFNKLLGKIIKASKGQRDAMYFAARRMNLIKDFLVVPILATSALMGSALLTSHVSDVPWMKWACASIAFTNALMLTIQKITRPGELGELYQTYGRKWELFALNVLSMRKWQLKDRDDKDDHMIHDAGNLITRYNTMIEQSPLLPRWALSKFKASNEDLSSDDEDVEAITNVGLAQLSEDIDSISIVPKRYQQHKDSYSSRPMMKKPMITIPKDTNPNEEITGFKQKYNDAYHENKNEEITKEHALKGSVLERKRKKGLTREETKEENMFLGVPSVHIFQN